MRLIDWIGIALLVAVGGVGSYFLVSRQRQMKKLQQAPAGAKPPTLPTRPVQAPMAPPQPNPTPPPTVNNIVNRKETNALDAGIAGINAGRDVLLGGIKAAFG